MTILYLLGGFLTAALLGALIIPNILLISYKKRLFDVPDKRKVHSIPVPRLGGAGCLSSPSSSSRWASPSGRTSSCPPPRAAWRAGPCASSCS